jgi:PilZ domain-containing protein
VANEKRRSPRMRLSKGTRGQLKSTVPVEILDLSETGLLFEVSSTLRPGSTYDLTATFGGVPFSGLVRVTRCRAGGFAPDGAGGSLLLFRAGGEFVGLSEKHAEGLRLALATKLASGATLKPLKPPT